MNIFELTFVRFYVAVVELSLKQLTLSAQTDVFFSDMKKNRKRFQSFKPF